MEWEIWAVGDGDFLYHVLNGLGMLTGDGSFTTMIAIGFLLAIIWVMFQGLMGGAKEINFQQIFVSWILFTGAFGMTAERVVVVDSQTGAMAGAPLDDVPLGVATAGGLISAMGRTITSWFEQAYSLPAGFEYANLSDDGFLTALEGVLRLRGMDFASDGDPSFHRSLANYIQHCTSVRMNVDGGNLTPGQLMNFPRLLDDSDDSIRFDSAIYTTRLYPPPAVTPGAGCTALGDGYNCECGAGYDVLRDHWQEIEGAGGEVAQAINRVMDELSYSELTSEIDNMLGAAGANQDYILNQIIRSAMEEGELAFAYEHGDMATATLIEATRSQRDLTWALEETMFRQIVTPLMTFMEAAMYAVTPITAFMLTFGEKGLSMFLKYLGFVVWTQLWMPTLAVINFYGQWAVHNAITEKQTALGGAFSMTSLSGIGALENDLQTWLAVAGMLAAATPIITLMLITGSAVAATSLARNFEGGSASVASDYSSSPLDVNAGQVSAGGQNMLRGRHGGWNDGLAQAQDTTQGEISVSDQMMRSSSEMASRANAYTRTATVGFGESYGSSAAVQDRFANTSSQEMRQSSGYSETSQLAMQKAETMGEQYGWNDQETRAFAASLTGGAMASIGGGNGLSAAINAGARLESSSSGQFTMSESVQGALRNQFTESGALSEENSSILSAAQSDQRTNEGVFGETSEARSEFKTQMQRADELRAQAQQQRQDAQNERYSQGITVPTAYGRVANEAGTAAKYQSFAAERMRELGRDEEAERIGDMSQSELAEHYRSELLAGPDQRENRGEFYRAMFDVVNDHDDALSGNLLKENLSAPGAAPTVAGIDQGTDNIAQGRSGVERGRGAVEAGAGAVRAQVGDDPGSADVRSQGPSPDRQAWVREQAESLGIPPDLMGAAAQSGAAMEEENTSGRMAEGMRRAVENPATPPGLGDRPDWYDPDVRNTPNELQELMNPQIVAINMEGVDPALQAEIIQDMEPDAAQEVLDAMSPGQRDEVTAAMEAMDARGQ